MAERYLIFNADDFGASPGVNRGIVEAHARGVVTSASLTVTGQSTMEAVALSRDHPGLAIGLHWDVWGEDEREFDVRNVAAVRDESHRHAHREQGVFEEFVTLVEPLGIPLRGDGRVAFVGGFYAQWEWRVTNLEYVSVPFLEKMLREEVSEGWTEFSCHPGYVSAGYPAVYHAEREAELATLTDPRIRRTIDELGIRLASYADYEMPPQLP